MTACGDLACSLLGAAVEGDERSFALSDYEGAQARWTALSEPFSRLI